MKLNNHGWGLQVMMVFVLILMICLVIVSALVNKNFSYLIDDNESQSFDYTTLEKKVIESSKQYIKIKNIDVNDTFSYIITVKQLQEEKLLDDLRDNFSRCTGYSVVESDGKKLVYNSYIKCGSNYKTKEYNSKLDN